MLRAQLDERTAEAAVVQSQQVQQEHLHKKLGQLQQELSELQGKHAEVHARAGLVEGLQHANTKLQHEISKAHLEIDHLERKAAVGVEADSLHSQVQHSSPLLLSSLEPWAAAGSVLFFLNLRALPAWLKHA